MSNSNGTTTTPTPQQAALNASRALGMPDDSRTRNAADLVARGKVELHIDSATVTTGTTEAPHKYVVKDDSRCPCYDAINHPQPAGCKHARASRIQRALAVTISKTISEFDHAAPAPEPACVAELYGDDLPTYCDPVPVSTNGTTAVEVEAPPVAALEPVAVDEAVQAPLAIPPQFITCIQGRDFVQYAGLLAMAHEKGLLGIRASFISVTADLALAEATADFKDGTSFSECGDATPTNVGSKVAPHFARMALTRAKARCLRDALNISTCSVEELA